MSLYFDTLSLFPLPFSLPLFSNKLEDFWVLDLILDQRFLGEKCSRMGHQNLAQSSSKVEIESALALQDFNTHALSKYFHVETIFD